MEWKLFRGEVQLSGEAPVRQTDQLPTLEGGFVSEDSGQGDIGGLYRIGVALPFSTD